MNHYEKLGVSKNASQKEIKDAYKKLVKKYHPDIYPGDKSFAEKKIKEINLAYDILSDKDSKKAYDDELNPETKYGYTPPNIIIQKVILIITITKQLIKTHIIHMMNLKVIKDIQNTIVQKHPIQIILEKIPFMTSFQTI